MSPDSRVNDKHWTPEHMAWCQHLDSLNLLADAHDECVIWRPTEPKQAEAA